MLLQIVEHGVGQRLLGEPAMHGLGAREVVQLAQLVGRRAAEADREVGASPLAGAHAGRVSLATSRKRGSAATSASECVATLPKVKSP